MPEKQLDADVACGSEYKVTGGVDKIRYDLRKYHKRKRKAVGTTAPRVTTLIATNMTTLVS